MKRPLFLQLARNGLASAVVVLTALSVAPEASADQLQEICQRYVCYQYGDRGSAVAEIQRALRIPVDGFYGIQTENSVRYFQRQEQLVFVDGVAGPETLTQLGLDSLIVEGGGGGGYPYPGYPGYYPYPDDDYLGGGGGGYEPPDMESPPYVVAIPGSDYDLLQEVRSYVAGAYITEASLGDYIQAGAYYDRDRAEQQSDYLRSRGFDARVTYEP